MYDQIDADLEATLFADLRQLTEMPDASTNDMHNVCNYIYWAYKNWHLSVPLKFELTEEQYKQCLVSYKRKDYEKFDATWELVYQSNLEYLKTLAEFAKIIEGQIDWTDAPTFMHYFNMQGDKAQSVMPKFVLFSAHAETIFPIQKAFQSFMSTGPFHPDPAAMLFVNFYECVTCNDGETYKVKVSFIPHDIEKEDADHVEHIVTMTTREFILFLEQYSIDSYVKRFDIDTTDVPQLCKEDYDRMGKPYSSPEAFRRTLYETFDYRPSSSKNEYENWLQ